MAAAVLSGDDRALFTLNLHGTTPLEVLSLACIKTCAHFLLVVFISVAPCYFKVQRTWERIFYETLILFLPFTLFVTILSPFSVLSGPILIAASFLILTRYRRAWGALQWTEVLLIPKKTRNWKIPLLTNIYCYLLICVVVCILAVDFDLFPKRLAKTELYGFSLMDIGVGGFIAINGCLSQEARYRHANSNLLASFKKAIISCVPILALGFQRLAVVKGVSYHEHVTEYGLHWNFFFTLAFVRLLGTLYYASMANRLKPLHVVGFLLISHQLFLSCGLSAFIQNDDRSNLLAANKEGIFSLPGYIALYISFVEIGAHIFANRNRGKNIDFVLLTGEMWILSAGTYAIMSLSHAFVEETSRRETNLAYVMWMICVIAFLLGLESLFQLITESLNHMGLLGKDRTSHLFAAIEFNALFVFLFANVLTGLINLAIDTTKVNALSAMFILVIYFVALSGVTEKLFLCRFKLKLPEKVLQMPLFKFWK